MNANNNNGNNQHQPEQYHDYSQENNKELAAMHQRVSGNDDQLSHLRAVGRAGSFALQLHYILQETQKENMEEIISWLPHGRAIKVHDKKRFEKEVLPLWFQQTKIESFLRQLNHYGFKRIEHGLDKNAYYHELFLRGKPELVHRMQRTKVKGTGRRKPSLPGLEPDLYAMPWMPELGDEKTANAAPSAPTFAAPAAAAPALKLEQPRPRMISAPQPANVVPLHSAVSRVARKLQQEGSRSVLAPPKSASVACCPPAPPFGGTIAFTQSQNTQEAVPPPAVVPAQHAVVPGLCTYPGGIVHYPNQAAEFAGAGSEWMVRFPSPPLALPRVPNTAALLYPPLPHPLMLQQHDQMQDYAATFWMSPQVLATMPMNPLVPIALPHSIGTASLSSPTMNGWQQQWQQQPPPPTSEAASPPSNRRSSSSSFPSSSSGSTIEGEN